MTERTDGDGDVRWLPALLLAAPMIGVAVALVAGPLTVVLGASRLAVYAIIGCGAWLSVRRIGQVDLATPAAVAAGAYGGGVATALAGWPSPVMLVLGGLAGGLVTGAVAAIGARVGRVVGALTSLAVAAGFVQVLASLPATGGVAGFHAVPLLTGADRGDLVVLLALAVAAVAVAGLASPGVGIAAAAVAIRARHVSAALGRLPEADAAVGGLLAGSLLGVGGAAWAATTGSVVPAAFDLQLAAALALAALLGGSRPLGGVLGALVVFGPGVVAPDLPVVGDTPVLVTGLAGLAILAWRPAGLLGAGSAARDPGPRTADPDPSPRPPSPPNPEVARRLDARGLELPGGAAIDVAADPGEVVALVGDNGAGKSTALARIAGQLDDRGGVALDGEPAPPGARRRARLGVARTWQHPPALEPADVLRAAAVQSRLGRDASRDGSVFGWATNVLGVDEDTERLAPAERDLLALAARRPAVALLDEPGAHLAPTAVVAFVRGLAAGGATVVVADHRSAVVAGADRIVRLPSPRGEDPRSVPTRDPAPPALEADRGSRAPDWRYPAPVWPALPALATESSSGDRDDRIVLDAELLMGPRAGTRHLTVGAGEAVTVENRAVLAALTGLATRSVTGTAGVARRWHRTHRSRIRLDGRRIDRLSTAGRVRRGLGIVSGDAAIAADVSVVDQLAAIAGRQRAERLVAAAPLLAGRGHLAAGVLSGGERRALAWLRCLAGRPRVVVLDRAGMGLDGDALTWAGDIVAAWRSAGVAVVGCPGRPEERRWLRSVEPDST